MGTLADAYVQILPTTKGFKSNLTSQIGGDTASAGDEAGASFGSNLVGKLKGVLAAAGIGAIVKQALDAGGALQQSIGGVETLYGDAADAIKGYASESYKFGVSANDYMEQSTSFAAALKDSLGGDVTKAAEAANLAIQDMADNSAKMGTDMASIQNAYQGFAKGNYTMLDNLKLGYGGTKTEMQRLLDKAGELEDKEYNIDNLADVYEAIHVIQEDLDLTGVAANEAETTFSGSMGAMKAAATDFLGNLALGNNVSASLENLIDTVKTFVIGNLIPMLGNLLKGIPTILITLMKADWVGMVESLGSTLVDSFGTYIMDTLPDSCRRASEWFSQNVIEQIPTVKDSIMQVMTGIFDKITEYLPSVLDSGIEIITNLANGVLSNLPAIVESAGEMLNAFINFVLENLPTIAQKGVELVGQLAQGVINNLPAIATSAGKVIAQIITTIAKNLPRILQTGIELIAKIASGIIKGIPQVVGSIPQVITGIKNKFSETDWGSVGKNIIQGIAKGIKNGVSAITNAAKDAAKSALDSAKDFLGIKSPSRVMRDQVGAMISAGMAVGITQNSDVVDEAMEKLTGGLTSDRNVGFRLGVENGQMALSRIGNGLAQSNAVSGYTQNITINSPTQLSPAEVARQTRNATRNMVLAMGRA